MLIKEKLKKYRKKKIKEKGKKKKPTKGLNIDKKLEEKKMDALADSNKTRI